MGSQRCPKCMGKNGNHNTLHTRYGNGGGGNSPCPNDTTRYDTTRDELTERIAELADQFACGAAGEPVVYALHGPTDFAEEVIALVRAERDAEIRELLLTHADGYIVARGQDGEAEAAFATKPWMEQILDHISLHGDGTGGQG